MTLRGQLEERRAPKAEFEEQRRLTFAIAYRMTGSVSDAEDIGQEAFLRLERARHDGVAVESPQAWLSTVTTRLAIDYMRSARARRESYVGPWLPEPLLTDDDPGPAERAEAADAVSQAFLVLLETLSPVERAVFLLRDVFGYDYPQIAEAVGKGKENCRQIARRARKHVEAREARFEADRNHGDELLDRFLEASESGDVETLKEVLAADAVVYSDGGGKVTAARRPFSGVDRIARFMVRDHQQAPQAGRLPPPARHRQRPAGPVDDRSRRQCHRRAHGRGLRRPRPDDPHRPQPGQAPAHPGLNRSSIRVDAGGCAHPTC